MIGIKKSVIAILGMGLNCWGLTGVAAYAGDCPLFLNNVEHFNSLRQGNKIILGQVPSHPYVVVVPGDRERDFQSIQQCIPDAFISRNRLGKYIHVGSFTDYITARRWEMFLRMHSLDARVVYFRNL